MSASAPTAVCYTPIGVVRSPHHLPAETPIQPVFARGCRGRVEVFEKFVEGLRDLEGFSYIYLIYHLHCAGPARLSVKPFLQDVEHGVFATRAPCRPNPIGLSIVELVGRRDNFLELDGLDILDGTPLIDIKPYSSRFDRHEPARNGWMDQVDEQESQKRGRRGYEA